MGNQEMPYAPTMKFGDAVKVCFSKYADFNGRASRAEYWWFWLFTFIVSAVLTILSKCAASAFGYLNGLFSLAVIVPSLAVAWRRMHDIGKGGGWWCVNFIPLIGFIWFVILAATQGEQGPNRFGDAPVQ